MSGYLLLEIRVFPNRAPLRSNQGHVARILLSIVCVYAYARAVRIPLRGILTKIVAPQGHYLLSG